MCVRARVRACREGRCEPFEIAVEDAFLVGLARTIHL